ncbi:GNAT family N-acetyltransferase [Nocardioides sp. KIGAM211]|uniref:GNAT family N-acetyltransferase n=1 Tax=Nocardioides luti TaxID=2761101 RepID=A0A7X0RIC7_9ACTN|nr:GNAT family N-acetyltransferase [Nocardioides luti]MBB6628876.1 GNAT family N-acetyltransferase [Nocardioides luti]
MADDPTAPTARTAPTLTDGTVTLRAHRPDDAQGSFEQCQDPLSQAWTTVPVPYTHEMAVGFVTEMMPQGWVDDREWGFAVEHEGQYAGTVSLRNEGDGRAEIAYGSHPRVRGTGAMERALRLLLRWGFEEQGLQTVIWWANRGNWASRRLAWRVGFSFDGTVRQWLPQRGELLDAWVGTLHRDQSPGPRTVWLDCPTLAGDGVHLRPMDERDVPRIVEACSDPRTLEWLSFLYPQPFTEESGRGVVSASTELRASGKGVTWAVTGDDDVMSGWLGFFGLRPGVVAELGYWAHPAARGRGLTTRAAALALGHARDRLGLQHVRARIAVGNAASQHVVETLGFEHTGVERLGADMADGSRVDLAIYDLAL